jgi:hypothetical protein
LGRSRLETHLKQDALSRSVPKRRVVCRDAYSNEASVLGDPLRGDVRRMGHETEMSRALFARPCDSPSQGACRYTPSASFSLEPVANISPGLKTDANQAKQVTGLIGNYERTLVGGGRGPSPAQ